MKQLSPKQQEIRDRQETLLDVAQEMLLTRGSIGLTMDRVADAIGVSKGTVYQHFANKEDLMAAVAVRSSEIRASLFERASAFRGNSRERMGAVGAAAELFFALFPHHEQAERTIRASSLMERISAKHTQGLEACTFRCFGVATGIARDAIASGHLTLREDQSVEQLCVGLWHLYTGAFLMRDLEHFMAEPIVEDPMPTLMANAQVFLDGFGWAPLSTEHDATAARLRVLTEVFPDEARSAGLLD